MRLSLHAPNLKSLRERFKNEIVVATLIVCVFTLIFSGVILFIDTYDKLYNSEIQQCYEVLKGTSVESGHKWWESKEIRLWTGQYQYNVDFMPYRTRIYDVVDQINEELRGKKILIQYRDRLWSVRSAVGIEYNGKVYINPEETLAIWERRVSTRDMMLTIYILISLLVLIPTTLGIIRIERNNS